MRCPSGFRAGAIALFTVCEWLTWMDRERMRMFADDVKIWNVIKSDTDSGSLQDDRDSLAR